MKWLVILIVLGLSLVVALDIGAAHQEGETETLTYIIHLDEGEERRDIDFGVISSESTTSSSTTLTTVVSPTSTTTTVPTTTTSFGTPTTTGVASPTTTLSSPVTTTTMLSPSTDGLTTPTLRNRTALALALIALLSYWLWKRRPRE